MNAKPRHKRQLLHESEGARHKLPGHRRPRKRAFDKVRTKMRPGGPAPGRPAPVPPTSVPPYIHHSRPWFDPGKEPIL